MDDGGNFILALMLAAIITGVLVVHQMSIDTYNSCIHSGLRGALMGACENMRVAPVFFGW